MDESIFSRLKHAWNVFKDRDYQHRRSMTYTGYSSGRRPDRIRIRTANEKSIITALYNKIAIDVASASIQHVRLDENERIVELIKSGLHNCLELDANLDQTGKAFMQDVVMSLFDEGCVAMVPIETSIDPKKSTGYDIHSLRTGRIINWFPAHVRVRVYNERTGKKEELILPKKTVAIIENPFYAVMNEPNSTFKRLIRKLNLLDVIDDQSGSGKLDLIIQLPYVIKTPARREHAENRRKDIEMQLAGSKYGIAYTDGTERVTQLNRPAENNLMNQITYLTSMLYSQLGVTEGVFNGTASEEEMLNYRNGTLAPILDVIIDEMKRKFLTKTARSQMQSIEYFMDPFKLVPVSEISNIADKFTRNEILSSNEVRAIIGYRPSDDPKADELRNKNLNVVKGGNQPAPDDIQTDRKGGQE